MKRALAGLALLVITTAARSGAAEQPAGFVIEQPHTIGAPPLDAEDMQRLAAGKPPRAYSRVGMGCTQRDGFVSFACSHCGSSHASSPELQFVFSQKVDFTIAGVVMPSETQGMRVLRGPDGAIQQVATAMACFFVSMEDKRIRVERYQAPDCRTAADGRMERLPWAKCDFSLEVRELAAGSDPNTRTFETKQFYPGHTQQDYMVVTTELSETPARAQAMTRLYNGAHAVPEAMLQQDLLQRVFLKEGWGYRQIIKLEKRGPDGVMTLDNHVIETWRVEPNGSRRVVSKEELKVPAREEDAGEVH